MAARTDIPTFVGPVTKEKVLPRVYRIGFMILQAKKDCSPITLEYPDKATALKLLSALQMAINQAKEG